MLQELYDAGARRYLLRIESSNPELYAALHPDAMSWQRRVDCLNSLKKIGYMVGCYFAVLFCVIECECQEGGAAGGRRLLASHVIRLVSCAVECKQRNSGIAKCDVLLPPALLVAVAGRGIALHCICYTEAVSPTPQGLGTASQANTPPSKPSYHKDQWVFVQPPVPHTAVTCHRKRKHACNTSRLAHGMQKLPAYNATITRISKLKINTGVLMPPDAKTG